VEEESNSTMLTVAYAELATSDCGNSEIQAYSLEVDDGHYLRFRQVAEPTMRLQLAMPAARGVTYRFRYRARNSVGWGPYSSVSSLLAA
jgi:hypothetical protein